MKKTYMKPMVTAELFSASEYVAACTITKENATLGAVCVNHVFGEHLGDEITELQTVSILGKTLVVGNVHYPAGVMTQFVTDWIDNDKDGKISEGDFIEWRSDCYNTVKSTQNHS